MKGALNALRGGMIPPVPLFRPGEGVPNIQHQHNGVVRTSMNCHACTKGFLAEIDHRVDASLVLSCPHCGHKHYRKVVQGIVSDDREGAQGDPVDSFQAKVKVWKHETLPAKASTTSEFLRHRWLNLTQNGREG